MPERPFIYRFTNDLRLDDHAGLAAAASRGPVIPLIVIDDGVRKRIAASPRRGEFFCAAVTALSEELEQRGSRLIVRRGEPEVMLPRVARETGASGVAWSASYDRAGIERDRRAASELEEAGWTALVEHDALVIPPEESAMAHSAAGSGYRAFAPYFDAWSKLPVTSHEYPLLLRFVRLDAENEPLPQPREFGFGSDAVEAGPAVARRRFDGFLRGDAAQYAIATTAPADDRTSHLSADLSFGTIAARTIARAVRDRLDDPFALSEERLSLRLFLRALAHRDFFLQLACFYPQAQEEPLQERMRDFVWESSHRALDAWREGMTGYPLVDAGVRQLRATGWMHPHVRAVAASFLCFDLGVDWRIGRDEWDRWLIEDDLSLATGNWQWIAGVGADMAQYPRIYNPERQRRRYDPAGTYVRRWIPELRGVPLDAWYERPSSSPQLALGLYDAAYPVATIDHGVAARAFLRRYREFSRRPR
ncbi:MAG TPA: deoxyribodipyrimidine photo-lyase [Candidatus Cybelea sp.]|jgi:deoxyribodipyrimidine photo-lyase|nr:deoxyribodipyrimidine photo-lyase [Candidatus Cybelea sp.]